MNIIARLLYTYYLLIYSRPQYITTIFFHLFVFRARDFSRPQWKDIGEYRSSNVSKKKWEAALLFQIFLVGDHRPPRFCSLPPKLTNGFYNGYLGQPKSLYLFLKFHFFHLCWFTAMSTHFGCMCDWAPFVWKSATSAIAELPSTGLA